MGSSRKRIACFGFPDSVSALATLQRAGWEILLPDSLASLILSAPVPFPNALVLGTRESIEAYCALPTASNLSDRSAVAVAALAGSEPLVQNALAKGARILFFPDTPVSEILQRFELLTGSVRTSEGHSLPPEPLYPAEAATAPPGSGRPETPTVALDEETRIIEANGAAQRLFGLESAALRGLPFGFLCQQREAISSCLKKFARNVSAESIEIHEPLTTVSGSISFQITARRGLTHETARTHLFLEITPLPQTRSPEGLHPEVFFGNDESLLSRIPAAEVDPDRRIVRLNQAFHREVKRIRGSGPGGLPHLDELFQGVQTGLREHCRASASWRDSSGETEISCTYEAYPLAHGHTLILIEPAKQPSSGADQPPAAAAGPVGRESLFAALEGLGSGLATFSPQGRLHFANPALLELLDLEEWPGSLDEFVGRFKEISALPEEIEGFRNQRQACLHLHKQDGRNLLVCRWTTAITSSSGKAGTVVVVHDVSALARQIREAEDNREMAEQANRAKSQFVSTMSHELRTPLNSIIGFAELLREAHEDDEDSEYLKIISSNAESLISMINQILDLSRIEAGRTELEEGDLELEPFMESVMQTMELKAQEKGVELACSLNPDLPEVVRLDGQRLRQILINLVGNALKFTEEGSVQVFVTSLQLRNADEKREFSTYLQFEVRDTGPGIDAELLQSIFEPFVQVPNAERRENPSGTGLGLAITRQLTQAMGGSVWVESEPGKGSRFFARVRTAPPEDPSATQPIDRQTLSALQGRSIWIVDPLEARRSLADWLGKRTGARTRSIGSATLALKTLDSGTAPDLFVTDSATLRRNHVETLARRLADVGGRLVLLSVPELPAAKRGRTGKTGGGTILERSWRPSRIAARLAKIIRESEGQAGKRTPAESTPGGRVLVAEDEDDNRRIITAQLQQQGWQVEAVTTGRAALDKLRQDPFKLILLDVRMPEMNGLDVARAIRSGEAGAAHRDAPMIAITAQAMEEDRDACLQAGFNEYLPKPLSLRDLKAAIKRLGIAEPEGS